MAAVKGKRGKQKQFSPEEKKQYFEGKKGDFAREFADDLIKAMQDENGLWRKPWKPGEIQPPINAETGKEYQGGNALKLALKGFSDPRWMTYKQAQAAGYQVRSGEKSTTIYFQQPAGMYPKEDKEGNPVLNEKGEQEKVFKPFTFRTHPVFHASQIDGIPEFKPAEKFEWEAHERAEKVLNNLPVKIYHDQADRAFYSPATDVIRMPDKSQFPEDWQYYSTALHEAGHSTGHYTRFDRDFSGEFGSKEYAKEELIAEITSKLTAMKLGIGHDPRPHLQYLNSWIKRLDENPNEIYTATAAATKAANYLEALELDPTLAQSLIDKENRQRARAATPEAGIIPADLAEPEAAEKPAEVEPEKQIETAPAAVVDDPKRDIKQPDPVAETEAETDDLELE